MKTFEACCWHLADMMMIFADVRSRGLPGQVWKKSNNSRDLCAFLLPRNGPGKHMGSKRKGTGYKRVADAGRTPSRVTLDRSDACQATKQQQSTTLAHAATLLAQGSSS